ncbi:MULTISPECIES: peptidylprolyl isomerase [Vibrio]|uniref:Periplasmic chaperone PpiD n=1 Tax=Vibrio diazotrophicus TaxID=685 RepID=A0ABX4WC24_VIBDI|nr:peptidylprolyl isomerase [Vibrio diazotrophicus]PNH98103.1 peptidylprolyl isomerase [Vibrio diazotrophicus]PNI01636.1 peptidylprolyl isomerase [Vibrio diazotrophicus]
MMDRLREGVNSIAVKIILGLIILSFIFAGVGSYLVSGGNNAAAKVGSIEIDRGQFEQAYQNERNRMQSQMGDYFANLLADPAYVASFRKSVLDRMINDVLIEQHANSLGLRISDEQVRKLILDMPQFQSEGKFDQEIYQAALRRAGFNAESFAEYLRRDLLRSQLTSALQGSEFTLQGEIDAQSALIAQTRDIRTVTLSLKDFASNVAVSDEDVQKFYSENPERYTRPEQVKVSYIELSAEKLAEQVTISDEQVKEYYQEHLDKYSTAEQREVSHILVQGDDEAKAQAILDELNAGADFAKLAEEKSEDIGSSENGGSLGWIEHDTMDPAFEAAAFGLASVGDVSGLVKSDFGYHIIKLDGIKASVAKPLEEVAAEIKSELSSQKAVDTFYELQTELEKVAFEYPDSLDEAAKAISAQVAKTDFISQSDMPSALQNASVQQAIQSPEVKEDGLNSSVIEVAPEHVVVVRVDETRPEMVLPLEEVKDQVVAQLSKVKGEQQALELADKLIAGLEQGDKTLLEENKLAFGELETVDRGSQLAQTVYSMPKPQTDQVVYAQAKDLDGNIVLIELSKVEAKIEPQYQNQIGAQLSRIAVQQDIAGVLSVLRANTDIEYFAVSQ